MIVPMRPVFNTVRCNRGDDTVCCESVEWREAVRGLRVITIFGMSLGEPEEAAQSIGSVYQVWTYWPYK